MKTIKDTEHEYSSEEMETLRDLTEELCEGIRNTVISHVEEAEKRKIRNDLLAQSIMNGLIKSLSYYIYSAIKEEHIDIFVMQILGGIQDSLKRARELDEKEKETVH